MSGVTEPTPQVQSAAATAPPPTSQLPILLYHTISDGVQGELQRYAIPPAQFEEQLRYLAEHGYRSVTLDEWQSASRRGRSLPGRAVMLTFDDGYRDFLTAAWPLLRAYGFTALVFVVAARAGETNVWDSLWEQELPLLNWDEIRELAADGVQFGSHTMTHPRLTALSTEQLTQELMQARLVVERELDTSVTAIAYPWGAYDATVCKMAWACGYEYGMTIRTGHVSGQEPLLELPRIEIFPTDTLDDFARKLVAEG